MRSIYLTLLLAVTSLLTSQTANAYDFEVDGIYYNLKTSEMTAYVTYKDKNYSSYSGNITIPEYVTYKGRKIDVVGIGPSSFAKCEQLLSITLHDRIKTIGESAFSACNNLTKISIPNTIEKLQDFTFDGCTLLKEAVLPNQLKIIPAAIFRDCINLKEINIPNSVSSIDRDAFSGCTKLKNLVLPANLVAIHERAFYNCKQINSLVIPSSVGSIDDEAFYGCNISNLKLEDSSEAIVFRWDNARYPFDPDHPINQLYIGRDIMRNDAYSWLYTKHSAKHIIIGGKVTRPLPLNDRVQLLEIKAGTEGFYYSGLDVKIDTLIINRRRCLSSDRRFENDYYELNPVVAQDLKVLITGDSIQTLGFLHYTNYYDPSSHHYRDHYELLRFSKLKRLVIGKNIKKLSKEFHEEQLDTIVSYIAAPFIIDNTAFSSKTYLNAVLLVPKGSLAKYMETEGWKNFFNIKEMDDKTTAIASTTIKKEKIIIGRYNMYGQKMNAPQKGINIIKYSDGTTQKVIIK